MPDPSDAVILENEYILCLNEYSAGSLAVTCEKRENIFNIVQGEKDAEIEDNEGLNVYKSFIQGIEGFDKELPFLIVTGNSQI